MKSGYRLRIFSVSTQIADSEWITAVNAYVAAEVALNSNVVHRISNSSSNSLC